MNHDKEIEHSRYEDRARAALDAGVAGSDAWNQLPMALQSPYRHYAELIRESIAVPDSCVLEIGAGTGLYTEPALKARARVIATDISASALEFARKRYADSGALETREADMESLPFADHEFDVVCCAGSLSYGDNEIVMQEIYRVLKPGGRFVCVDSLNHNPIYRLNRWIQYRRGRRTRSTIERMPTVHMIQAYRNKFGRVEARYFGAITWLAPLLGKFMSDKSVGEFCDKFDVTFDISKSAFKFVMVAEKPGL